MQTYAGCRIFQADHMVKQVEDWSRVRSPSRARRRMRQGHKQNVRTITVPDPAIVQIGNNFYMHPETYRKLEEQTSKHLKRVFDDSLERAIFGLKGLC
jgi:hypothetical protein